MGEKDNTASEFLDSVISPVTGRPAYFDRDGNPISLRRWGELHEGGLDELRQFDRDSYVRVGYDEVGEASVSTVWLGLDHGFCRPGPGYRPIIFETMVFGGDDDQFCLRYCREEEARVGHQSVVLALREGLPLESDV